MPGRDKGRRRRGPPVAASRGVLYFLLLILTMTGCLVQVRGLDSWRRIMGFCNYAMTACRIKNMPTLLDS
jgi:hypothetical protein